MTIAGAPDLERHAPVTLAFDTAGSACSVVVARGDAVIAAEHRPMRHGHAEALLPMIDRVMKAAGLAPHDIDSVAVSVGPGGFTGIRAGLAAAHGLALAARARLLGVTNFAAVAASLPIACEGRLLVALDSRRADIYTQLFDAHGVPAAQPRTMPQSELAAWVGDGAVVIAGDAADVAAAALTAHAVVTIVPNSAPEARGVLAAARRWPDRADPAARPLYLRSPDVSFPKAKRGLGGTS